MKKLFIIIMLGLPVQLNAATPDVINEIVQTRELCIEFRTWLGYLQDNFPDVKKGLSLNYYSQTKWGEFIDRYCPISGRSLFSPEFQYMCSYLFWTGNNAESVRVYLDEFGENYGEMTDRYSFYNAFCPCDNGGIPTEKAFNSINRWICVSCSAGTYSDGKNCNPCPDDGTSDDAAAGVTQCYIPAGITFSDDGGQWEYSEPCYYAE